jgi:hypothetical protein
MPSEGGLGLPDVERGASSFVAVHRQIVIGARVVFDPPDVEPRKCDSGPKNSIASGRSPTVIETWLIEPPQHSGSELGQRLREPLPVLLGAPLLDARTRQRGHST